MLAEETVDEVEVLVGHIDSVAAQQLVHLDEVHAAAGYEAAHVGEAGGH